MRADCPLNSQTRPSRDLFHRRLRRERRPVRRTGRIPRRADRSRRRLCNRRSCSDVRWCKTGSRRRSSASSVRADRLRREADPAAGVASSRPARSSSSSTSWTSAGDAPDRRTSRRPATGDGPSSSSIALRAARRRRPRPVPASNGSAGSATRPIADGRERLDHVGGVLDQRRAVADQLVAALRARIERRAGHRHHLAPRLRRQPRGDQRARPRRRLDHHRPGREPGDDPVAIGEMARARLGPRRHFGEHQPALRTSRCCRASFSGG